MMTLNSLYGHLSGLRGRYAIIKLDTRDIERLDRLVADKGQTVELRTGDGRRITPGQRRKAYELLSDLAKNSGYTKDQVKAVTKQNFLTVCPAQPFSLSDVPESVASKYIDYLLHVFFAMDYPLNEKSYRLVASSSYFQKLCLKYHCCMACGGQATRIAYYGRTVILLCDKHQRTFDRIGAKRFIKLYHLA